MLPAFVLLFVVITKATSWVSGLGLRSSDTRSGNQQELPADLAAAVQSGNSLASAVGVAALVWDQTDKDKALSRTAMAAADHGRFDLAVVAIQKITTVSTRSHAIDSVLMRATLQRAFAHLPALIAAYTDMRRRDRAALRTLEHLDSVHHR